MSGRDRKTGATRPRRRVETCQEYLQAQRNGKSHAASTIKPEDREFVVDSGASMRMVSRKDLNSAEVETAKVSKSPTMLVTVNGEVLTKEEATVYVKQLDLFVTVMLLEDTLAVLSLGKLCEDPGYNYRWTSGQKPRLIKMAGRSIATQRTSYPSLSPVHRQAPQAHLHLHLFYLHRRKPQLVRSISYQQEVIVRVRQYRETCRMDQQKPKTQIKMTTTWMYKETCRMICQNGYRS